ncbi:MAG: hypothetical protein KKF68_03850 [Nanoarchaeota archaeon]|nr:hypothetical protein [Nanoarchaeota archaeon]
MKYKRIFEIKGKWGLHAGPSGRIVNICIDYPNELEDPCEIEVTIRNHGSKKGINALDIYDVSNILRAEGSMLEVEAKLIDCQGGDLDLLKRMVEDIGEVIEDVDKYTLRHS